MKQIILFLCFFSCTFHLTQAREKKIFNFDWKHKIGEHYQAINKDYDDKDWEIVHVPHDATISGPFTMDLTPGKNANGFLPKNIGWYRKEFYIDQNIENKKIFIEFEGVHRDASIWINEQFVGRHLNGYLDFEFEISNYIKKGRNLIALRYDNTYKFSSRWYNGEGINRNVWLIFTNKLHIDRYGTYITTPKITEKAASVNIETTVINSFSDSIICRLKSDIISPDGKIVASRLSVVPVGRNESYVFRQEAKVSNPELWDIISPNLYKVKSYLYKNDELLDEYETNFGIREIEMNAEQGLLLNGRKVFIKGVCLHHDLGPVGASAFEAGYKRRLERIKEMGINGIRLSHNPFPKYVLDWCDKNGILVFDEVFDQWNSQFYGAENAFEDYWQKDTETWLKRDRNHPSVFIWSVGNEVRQTRFFPEFNPKTGKEEIDSTYAVAQLKKMVDFVRKIEPTRKITTALYPHRVNGERSNNPNYENLPPPQASFHSDVMSVNYMQRFLAKDKEKYPQLVQLVSEAGTGIGGYSYFEYDHSTVVGHFYWGGTEYIGESFGWPSKGWINGIIDLCDNIKPVGHSIKSFYSEKPVLQLVVHDKSKESEIVWNDLKMSSKPMFIHWNWTKGSSLDLQTFSNCEEVELFVNSKLIGRKKMSDYPMQKMIWNDILYQQGEVKAIGYNQGIKVAESTLKTAGKPYKIRIIPERSSMNADGLDLAYFNIEVVDSKGNIVPVNDINVKFKINGNATIAGVGNGNIMSCESWQADNRTVHEGKALLILRSTRDAGKITITASAKSIKSDTVIIESIK